MKIRFWDRMILMIGAGITMLVGAVLLVTGLRNSSLLNESLPGGLRALRILSGAACSAFSVYLFAMPQRYAMQRRDYVVQRTDTGELRIAVKAIKNLVEKCVDLHEEIQLIAMSIVNTREGVVVELNISLANNISIPLAVASLQKQIKQYLVASSGIEVREVRVIVETTKDEPLLVAEIEEEEENEPEKAPMHQRLFCQAEQPAIVPEPPKLGEEIPLPGEKTMPESVPEPVSAPRTEDQENES